jgi:tRNA(Ile)-lysidine synthase
LSEKYKTDGIVIAHHKYDKLETYLIQKEKKSLVNHWGLPFESIINGFKVYRPALEISKEEIMNYLELNKIDYATDYTNDLEIYKRNRLRKELFCFENEQISFLEEEIKNKNRNLEELKRKILFLEKKVFSEDFLEFDIKECKDYDREVILRLVYF